MTTRITYGLQYTRNLGNFENARVHYEISDDVRDDESLEDARKRVVNKVNRWVQSEVERIDNEAG